MCMCMCVCVVHHILISHKWFKKVEAIEKCKEPKKHGNDVIMIIYLYRSAHMGTYLHTLFIKIFIDLLHLIHYSREIANTKTGGIFRVLCYNL